jgi:hypothetical protein
MPQYMSNILTISPDKDFVEEMECDYKGEHYSVRDNGAIMRHARGGKPVRKEDNMWTFGTKDDKTGYMMFSGARVHIIVATAFYGENDSKVYVVDHKDTNRCNNRPDNLRWCTRLENALNNPATRKKIIFLCGSVENFINDPSSLRDATGSNQDVMWMRTVTAEEAKAAYAHIMEWAEKPSEETPSHGGRLGGWIYQQKAEQWQPNFSDRDKPNEPSKEPEKPYEPQTVGDLKFSGGALSDLWDTEKSTIGFDEKPQEEVKKEEGENSPHLECYKTSNQLAVQHGWAPYTTPEFPCCPNEVAEHPIQEYANQLAEGKVFVSASYGESTVYKHTICGEELLIITRIPNGVKSFALARVTWNGKAFIHESMGTYFQEDGVMAAFTRAQGLEWNGPESIDDYC